MNHLYLSLGTNLGEKEQNLRRAVDEIEKQIGTVVSLSAFYATEPWGFQSANSFLNAVLVALTPLSPLEALERTQQIERLLGRTSKSIDGHYHDRLIDIDLLFYNDLVATLTTPTGEQLVLPHPHLLERDFVMLPLAEIAPELVHPVAGKTIRELAG
ncbi:MAG: 2-amino-4-hydroxy-6-hydroxymethyldihydropteridine diphosphokinase [Mediterranea sp.]|nr:2-amino-4-hydroxy-6-hydroxymethyldihydropteridine diphosphokinase [Mediterranea sp.]